MKPQDALRSLADTLDFIEKEYGAECSAMRGQAVLGKENASFKNVDIDRFWPAVDENNYGFIGIMPNQNRPEVHINATIREARIRIYTFVSSGYNHYDGGFLSEYPKMMERLKNAPDFILEKLNRLHEHCERNNEKDNLESELERTEAKKADIEKKLEQYSDVANS